MFSILDALLFQGLYRWFHQPHLVSLWEKITHLGDPKVGLSLAALGFLEATVAWMRARGAGRVRSYPLLAPWVAIPGATILTGWLKGLINRPRPVELYQGLGFSGGYEGPSFPSGHATLSFALAAALCLRWPKGKFLWLGTATLVAISRVVLGVHWVSDVVVGAAIGWGVVFGSAWVEQRFRFSLEKRRRRKK